MAEKVKNKKGKKRKVGRVFLVIGIILSMALGSMLWQNTRQMVYCRW